MTNFFLGANSSKGFVSYFRQLQNQSDSLQLLILKGGPGCGKSSLMKKVADYALEKKHNVELIPCASDPESLDAVIDKTANFAIMDGTAPHTEDPSLPGVYQHILNMGDSWDTGRLRPQKEEIAFFSDLTGEYHNGAGAYIKAAGALLEENLRISKKYTNEQRVFDFVKKTMGDIRCGKAFSEEIRLLSGATVGEIRFFSETLSCLADKIYVIEDEWGGACDILMNAVKTLCRISGVKIILCPCSIVPEKIDHIIIPGAKTAFSLGNRFLKSSLGERIKGEVFYTEGIDRIVMEKRSADAEKLLTRATTLIKTAKKTHDRLERFYINAMDFKDSDKYFKEILKNFYSTDK